MWSSAERWRWRGFTLVGALLLASAITLHKLAPKPLFAAPFYDGCNKVWSHRASAPGAEENSIEGAAHALALGAAGVEIDVIYHEAESRFFVISEEALSTGVRADLPLEKMLHRFPRSAYVWLDFWNLTQLSDEAGRAAAARLRDMLEAEGLLQRAIVESTDSRKLSEFSALGVYTSLWLTIRPSKAMLGHIRDVIRAAEMFRGGRYAAVSLNYLSYSRLTAFVFADVPTHLFTVNDLGILRRLTAEPQVRIVLTDRHDFAAHRCGAESMRP
jgi:hypothetical protein